MCESVVKELRRILKGLKAMNTFEFKVWLGKLNVVNNYDIINVYKDDLALFSLDREHIVDMLSVNTQIVRDPDCDSVVEIVGISKNEVVRCIRELIRCIEDTNEYVAPLAYNSYLYVNDITSFNKINKEVALIKMDKRNYYSNSSGSTSDTYSNCLVDCNGNIIYKMPWGYGGYLVYSDKNRGILVVKQLVDGLTSWKVSEELNERITEDGNLLNQLKLDEYNNMNSMVQYNKMIEDIKSNPTLRGYTLVSYQSIVDKHIIHKEVIK